LGVICFRPKNQSFLQEKEPATFSHGQGTHSANILLRVWPKIPQMPQNISAQKFRIFEKKLSLGIRSPCLRTSDFDDYEL
jgi:hypothetical protein